MRGVQLTRMLLIAAVIEAVGLAANAVTSLVTDKASGAGRWVLPPLIAVIAAMAKALIDAGRHPVAATRGAGAAGSGPPPGSPVPGAGGPGPYRPPGGTPASYGPGPGPAPVRHGAPQQRRRWWAAALAILIVLVSCGGGGVAITAGVRYAVGYVTGNESGPDVLVRPVSGRAGGLTLTVEKVQYTDHFTRVTVVARNGGRESVGLPLFDNCVFAGADGTTLQADPFRSRWSETLAPGGTQRGIITFPGKLPDRVGEASLSFSQVFALGGGAATVPGIVLRTG